MTAREALLRQLYDWTLADPQEAADELLKALAAAQETDR